MSFFYCPNCPKFFRLSSTFEAHIENCGPVELQREKLIVCGICHLSFELEFDYDNHFSGDMHRAAAKLKRRHQVSDV